MLGSLFGGFMNGAMGLAASAMNYNAVQETNKANLAIARGVSKTNVALAREQNEWNRKQWEDELEYNRPENQVQRLREAGLSDAAAAMSSGNIAASPLQSADLAKAEGTELQAPQFNPPNFLGILREVMALRKDKVEAETMEQTQESDINGILSTNEAKSVALKLTQENLRFAYETNPYSAASLRYKSLADSHLEDNIKLTMAAAENNLKLAQQKYDFLEKMHTYEFKQAEQEINNLVATYDKIQQDINTGKSQEDYYEGLQSLTKEQIETQKEETKNKSIANLADGIDAVLKKYGSPSNNAEKIGALVREGILQPSQVVSYLQNARDYVLTGQDVFSGDTDLRNVFINEINPGIGENRKQPLWNIGTFDNLWNRVKQPYKGLKDSFRTDHSNGNRYHYGF